MPLQAYFNKLVLRGSASDGTPTTIEEDSGGDLLLTSGSGTTKLAGSVQYYKDDTYQDLNSTIDALQAAGGISFDTTPTESSASGVTSGGVYAALAATTLQATYDGGDGRIQVAANPLTVVKDAAVANSLVVSNSAQTSSLVVSGENLDLITPGRVNAGWMTLGGGDLQGKLNAKQDTIGASDLSISDTSGLQSALNSKQPAITGAHTLTPSAIDLSGTYSINMSGSTINSVAALHLESNSAVYLDADTVYYRNTAAVDTALNTTLDSLRTDVDAAQSTLTAGDGITIDSGIISASASASDTITAGTNLIRIDDDIRLIPTPIVNGITFGSNDGNDVAFMRNPSGNLIITQTQDSVLTIEEDLYIEKHLTVASDINFYRGGILQSLNTALDGKADTSSMSGKQDVLTAGDNITIVGGLISASVSGGGSNGVTYTEGSNIDITADDVIKVEDNPTFTNSVIAGATKIGGIGGSALFSQSGFTSWADAALIQWDTGHTIINCALNKEIYFRNGGAGSRTFAKIDNQGEFHIYRDGSLQKINDVLDEISSSGGGGGGLSTAGPTYRAGANIFITEDFFITVIPMPTFTNSVTAAKTRIGGLSDRASLSHINYTSWRDTAFHQLLNGTTLINSKSGTELQFAHNGDVMAKFINNEFHITRDGTLQNLNAAIDEKQDVLTAFDDTQVGSLMVGSMIASINNGEIIATGAISGGSLTAGSLSIAPDVQIETIIGKCRLGDCGHSDNVCFSHYNHNTQTNYGFMQNPVGATIINSASGQDIWFRNSNNNKMVLKSNGYLGIGTTNPGASLQVENAINFASWGTWFDAHNTWRDGETIHGYARRHQTREVSIMGRGILSWAGFYAASDKRFKTNIQDIDDASALDLLRTIKPKTYDYIDKNERGADTVYGFIAQDIAEVFPNCVSIQREKIPNIYELGVKSDNVITLTNKSTSILEKDSEGVVYPTLLVYHQDELKFELTIKSVIDDKRIEIEPMDGLDAECQLFIYGQIVDNFQTIDKNYIFTIATAALQEVDRQLQVERSKTAALESKMAAILARLDAAGI